MKESFAMLCFRLGYEAYKFSIAKDEEDSDKTS
jgi:hypothetical protein